MRKVFVSAFLMLSLSSAAQEPKKGTPGIAEVKSDSSVTKAKLELEAMMETDQSLRLKITELEKTQRNDSPEISEAWSRQSAIDAQNLRRLDEIVSQFGWPEISTFGSKAATTAFLIVQHSELDNQKKYFPLIKAAAAKGEAKRSSLALLEDRMRLREGLKRIYGSQVHRNDLGEWEPLPLEDAEHVDALRATVGLAPIAAYLKGFAERGGGKVNPKWVPAELKKDADDTPARTSPMGSAQPETQAKR